MYQHIFPRPQSIKTSEGRFMFGTELTLEISKDFSMEDSLALVSELWNNFTVGASKLNIKKSDKAGDFLWRFGAPREVELENEFSYIVHADEGGVAIKGKDDLSLLHGFYTLLQMISTLNLKEGEESFAINCGEVKDAPQLENRFVHLCIHYGLTLKQIQKYIRFAGLLKFSHIILEYYGSLKFDCLKELAWPNAFTKDEMRPLIEEAKLMGMEVIPMFNSLGHAGMADLMNCKHVILDQNPRLALLFEPTGWSFCTSNPDTKKLVLAASEEVIELCGPGSYFHMGLDEALDFASCDICASKDKGELLAEYVNDIAAEVRKKGRRTMIWGDMLLKRQQFDPELTYRTGKHFSVANATDELCTHKALDKIDRDVIICDWQYYLDSKENTTSEYFASKGFDVIPASWNKCENMQELALDTARHNYLGYMSTTWGAQKTNIDFVVYSADVAWNAKDAATIDSFRLEERFHWGANVTRKIMPGFTTYEEAGWF